MLETIIMALGLAVDASCVSMSNAMTEKNMRILKALAIASLFGIFQAVMPMFGYFAGTLISKYISAFIPVIALIILSALGIKMIVECVKDKAKKSDVVREKTLCVSEILIQAFATSIDALSIGVVYVNSSIGSAMLSFGIIGAITFLLSFIAFFVGKKFGTLVKNKAAIIGGIILIAIGLKIFLEYIISLGG